jgi:hypothetical protein
LKEINDMKHKNEIIAILAVAVCFAACGKVDDSSSKSGKVSLETKSTTATAVTTLSDDSSSVAETTAVTTTTAVTDTTSSVAETTTATTTTAETTTTTAQPTETQAQQEQPQETVIYYYYEEEQPEETQQQEEQPQEQQQEQTDPNSLRGKMRINYNGFEFGIGDQMSAVEGNLGSQPAPSSKVSSCIGDEIVTEYYFYGMTLQVNNGIIFSIDIMDNGYYGNTTPATVTGLSCDMSKSDIESRYGSASSSDEYNYYYTDGSRTMQISVFDDKVARIWINDSDLG